MDFSFKKLFLEQINKFELSLNKIENKDGRFTFDFEELYYELYHLKVLFKILFL